MTHVIRTRIFLLVILLGSGLGVKAQSWDWRHTFPVYNSGASFTPADSTLFGPAFFSNDKLIEVNDIAPGSDGRLYSCGLFFGKEAHFGNLTVSADTLLPRKVILSKLSENLGSSFYFQTAFLACQNSNGEYLWVKTLTSTDLSCPAFMETNNRGGFYKLCLGPDGSIYAAGRVRGDSVNYNGTSLLGSNLGNHFRHHFVILKVNPNGGLIWHRTFEFEVHTPNNPPSHWYASAIFPRYFQYGTTGPELMLNGTAKVLFAGDSTIWSGPLYVSLSSEGQVLQVRKEPGNGHPFYHQFHSLTRRLKDKRWLISYLGGYNGGIGQLNTPGFPEFEIYSPDFSQKLHRISFHSRGLKPETPSWPTHPSDPAEFFLQEAWDLPDGHLGIVLSNMNRIYDNAPYLNISLIVNADTLDISPYFLPGNNTRSLFIKLNQEGCMKQIKPLSYLLLGEGAFTENGHLLTCGPVDTVHGLTSVYPNQSKLLFMSKNGDEISQTALGDGIVSPNTRWDDFIFHSSNLNPQTFQIRTAPTGNKAWICTGNFVGQFTYPDPAMGDESAAGCLRGNAITSTREIQKQDLFLSQSQSGVEIRASDNQSGRYRILGNDGRLLEEGSWKGSQTPIGRSIRAKGMYQVMLSGSGNPKTLRYVQY